MLFKLTYWTIYIVLWPIYRFRFVNREKLPEGAAVVCGNHTALIDSVLVVLSFGTKGDYIAMAKKELFRPKIFAKFLTFIHVFSVDRGNNDMAAVKHALSGLKSGRKLLIFPEGTRVKGDDDVEAKTGAGMFALRTGVPMVPVYITAGKKAFRGCKVVYGDPFIPECEGKPGAEDYRRVTDQVMDKIFEIGKRN